MDHARITREIIPAKLREIEQKEHVHILHCVESGSRAWGFASPNSDYDVRFIYVRPLEYYLRLEKTRDVIEWQLDDTLDINGWDLQKALRLLHSSNPTLFEWNNTLQEMKFSDYHKVREEVTPGYRERKHDVLGRSTHKASKILAVLTLLTCFGNASLGEHFILIL